MHGTAFWIRWRSSWQDQVLTMNDKLCANFCTIDRQTSMEVPHHLFLCSLLPSKKRIKSRAVGACKIVNLANSQSTSRTHLKGKQKKKKKTENQQLYLPECGRNSCKSSRESQSWGHCWAGSRQPCMRLSVKNKCCDFVMYSSFGWCDTWLGLFWKTFRLGTCTYGDVLEYFRYNAYFYRHDVESQLCPGYRASCVWWR